MKKIFLFLSLTLLFSPAISFAQLKIGYVDSKTVLDKLPDAKDAQQKLDTYIREWRSELSKMEGELNAKKNEFDRRKLIMTAQTKNSTEKEISDLQKQIDEYRDKKFGTRGELYQKQDELMRPIQNKVYSVIKEVANEENLDFVFDRSSDVTLLFAKKEYDITPLVIDKLKLN
ncbi:MAG TPA: OmpH family outer membrane protein [Ignavibacteriaceae bacterium]|nr:OmpH family outer membrane protein [Ignavibacteriaceae bacterium]